MNSGVMVIELEYGLKDEMIHILKNEKFDKNSGKQDIINRYFDWKNKIYQSVKSIICIIISSTIILII